MKTKQELYDKEKHKITNWLVDLAVYAQCDAFHMPLEGCHLEWHYSSHIGENVEIPENPTGLFWEVKDSVGDLKIVIDALDEAERLFLADYKYEVYWWIQQYTVGDDPKVHEDPHWLIWLPELPKMNT